VNKTLVRFSLVALAVIALLAITGIMPFNVGVLAAVSIQAVAFAVAAPCPQLFNTVLTPEQLKEFEGIMKDIGGSWEKIKGLPEQLRTQDTLIAQLKSDLDAFRKAHLNAKRTLSVPRKGQVSDECARHLGALYLAAALRQEKCPSDRVDRYQGIAKDILGEQLKTALTSSDIPLPVDYSGDVVELVSQFGAARQFGTVYPLGTGTSKLPRLKTDTVFGLLAQSTAITQKSPQTEWVTFAAEKFGGLVLLPTEIDEDSIVAMGQFLARYSARNMARVEDQVFFMNLDGATYGAVEGLAASTITNTKVEQLASTKTAYSDATLAKIRAVRSKVDAAAIGTGAYYMHPSFEQLLSGLNTSGDKPYQANGINGASLDGFPIRWVDIMPAYSTSANASKVFMLFGDLSYQYLGVRGGMRFQTSVEAGFATDDIYVRALERFTIGLMATGAVAGLQTAAS